MLGDKIAKLRKDMKLTQKQLADELGMAQSTIGMIERNERGAGNDLLIKIANFFNVSIDFLLTTEEKLNMAYEAMGKIQKLGEEALNKTSFEMQNSIYAITSKYRKEIFSEDEQKEITNFIDFTLAKRNQNEKAYTLEKVAEPSTPYATKHKVKVLGQVAAGLPIEAIEDIEVVEVNNLPYDTDFALRVKGDSMEPLIHDGSLVFVHKLECIEHEGQICVVQYNNETTCKKVYRMDDHIELHSLNSKYEPMIVRCEDFKILGKVIFN